MQTTQYIEIKGILGQCGGQPVFLGFAPAAVLVAASFADVFDESRNSGYQRPINAAHSAEFRRYIRKPGSTTIPLTFNLREGDRQRWEVTALGNGAATLRFEADARVFAQVDCQHRLGHLADLDISLAFMSFMGLSVDDERRVFTTINSKAKGLSGSLLDANLAKTAGMLSQEVPNLYIAMRLADDEDSPWQHRLRKGGVTTGLRKPASLRMMNRAASRFLRALGKHSDLTIEGATDFAKSFWRAVAAVFPEAWGDPRRHFITKGVGIYSLMSLAGELSRQLLAEKRSVTQAAFAALLEDHLANFDWSHDGPLNSLNGAKGAEQALNLLRESFRSNGTQPRESTWPTRTFS